MGRSRRSIKLGNPNVAVGYLRCSTDHQDLSPEAQRAAIEHWAADNGVAVVAWHFDQAVSGTAEIEERAGLVAALADLRIHGAGVLVVAKRDRLARDTLVAQRIERAAREHGAVIASADGVGNGDDAASQMLRAILDAVAAYERQAIRARIKAALGVKKGRSELVGSVPFGFTLGDDAKTLMPHEAEQKVIEFAKSYKLQGLSLRAVAAKLEAEGFVSRTGAAFDPKQIQRMLAA